MNFEYQFVLLQIQPLAGVPGRFAAAAQSARVDRHPSCAQACSESNSEQAAELSSVKRRPVLNRYK